MVIPYCFIEISRKNSIKAQTFLLQPSGENRIKAAKKIAKCIICVNVPIRVTEISGLALSNKNG
jgi:hypothetical protein